MKEINKTYLTLILKKENPDNISHFKPISFCNVSYKIISKHLTSSLRSILPKIISPLQSAFVPKEIFKIIAHKILVHSAINIKLKVIRQLIGYGKSLWWIRMVLLKKNAYRPRFLRCLGQLDYEMFNDYFAICLSMGNLENHLQLREVSDKVIQFYCTFLLLCRISW